MRTKSKKAMSAALLSACFIAAGVLSGCGAQTGSSNQPGSKTQSIKNGGTLVAGLSGNPQTFNPDAQPDSIFDTVAQNVFSRLVEINADQQIIPDLAKTWTISPDGTTYTFHLHNNVKWQDGTNFTSSDVKFTFESIIKNHGYISPDLSEVKAITTPNPDTVVIQLKKPDNSFLGNLGGQGAYILPQHIYSTRSWATGTNTTPVGTGPFKFSSYTPGTSITLVKNASYFGQVPHVDKLVFSIITDPNAMLQSFLNGNIDVYTGTIPGSAVEQMVKNPKVIAKPILWPSPYYVAFNMNSAPFNNQKVREAVAYALDDSAIVSKTMPGQAKPAQYFISPVYKWAVSNQYTVPKYDPQKAKSLLAQAGIKPGELTVNMTIASMYDSIATVIKYQLKQVGINVNIQSLDFGTWQQQVVNNHKFQLTVLANYEGPTISSIDQMFETGGNMNFMGLSNKTLDNDLQQASVVVSKQSQVQYYQQVQQILSTEMPIVPIFDWLGYMPVRSYVEGYPTSPEAIGHTSVEEYNYVWLNN